MNENFTMQPLRKYNLCSARFICTDEDVYKRQRMFSASLFQGVREVFSQAGELDPDQLCEVLRIYFGLFLNMFSPAAKGDQR